ncbi:MAG: HEPN domain-containing protein [Firmicutes bacterium]|nr:HEPN domain-containing protein [Bacillota bacterium]
MSNEEQREEVVRYWWSKAGESLASARREFEARSYDFAINRLYYAAFYAVSAALLERRLSFKKHSGVRATFHQEFIKTGDRNNKGQIKRTEAELADENRHEAASIFGNGAEYPSLKAKKSQWAKAVAEFIAGKRPAPGTEGNNLTEVFAQEDKDALRKPRDLFSNADWQRKLEIVATELVELRTRFELAARGGEMIIRPDGFYAFQNHDLPHEIDARRSAFIALFNEILCEASLPTIKGIVPWRGYW